MYANEIFVSRLSSILAEPLSKCSNEVSECLKYLIEGDCPTPQVYHMYEKLLSYAESFIRCQNFANQIAQRRLTRLIMRRCRVRNCFAQTEEETKVGDCKYGRGGSSPYFFPFTRQLWKMWKHSVRRYGPRDNTYSILIPRSTGDATWSLMKEVTDSKRLFGPVTMRIPRGLEHSGGVTDTSWPGRLGRCAVSMYEYGGVCYVSTTKRSISGIVSSFVSLCSVSKNASCWAFVGILE